MNNVIRISIRIIIRIIIRNVIRITFFFGQNRLISEHNIDKNDIFMQRNQNFQEYMLHIVYEISFSIRTGTSSPLQLPAFKCVDFIVGSILWKA